MLARRKIFGAIEALQDKDETPPGDDPESHKVRSVSVLLKRDKAFEDDDKVKEALRAAPGTGHASV